MPPMTPEPSHISQSWWEYDAHAEIDEPAAPAECGDDAGLARAGALEPAAPDRRRGAKKNEEERVDPAEIGIAPVAARGERAPMTSVMIAGRRRIAVTPSERDSGNQNTLKP